MTDEHTQSERRQQQLTSKRRVDRRDMTVAGVTPMTARHWKLSQIISLAFIAAIFAFGILGSLANATNSLISETPSNRAAG